MRVQGVTQFENGNPVHFVAFDDWLVERARYQRLLQLSFFENFRRVKRFQHWKHNVRARSRFAAGKILEVRLLAHYLVVDFADLIFRLLMLAGSTLHS